MFEYNNIEELIDFLTREETSIRGSDDLLNLKKDLRLHSIPKRKGGYRNIYIANQIAYESISDKVRDEINRYYNNIIPEYVCGYIKGKNIVDNARIHLNSKIVINIDIENFFDTINTNQIKNCLIYHSVNESIAGLLANFMTIENTLITGSSFSPVMSNLVFLPIDKEINIFCISYKKQIRYSRYADDITFSSLDKLEYEEVYEILTQIKKILNKYEFTINNHKTKIYTKKYAQYVTGLTVNDNKYPRIPKTLKRQFRLTTYYMRKYGADDMKLCSHPYSGYFFHKKGSFSYSGREQRIYGIEYNFMKSIERMNSKIKPIKKDYNNVPSLDEILQGFSS